MTGATLQTALQHHREGRLRDARAVCEQLLENNPRNANALHLLGVVALQRGKYRRAVKLLREAIALNPEDADYHVNLSGALRALGRTEAAVAAAQEAIRLDVENPVAWNNAGIALTDLNRLKEGEHALEAALKLKVNFPEAQNNLGVNQKEQRRLDMAEHTFRAALKMRPDYVDARNNLGLTLYAMNRHAEAAEAFSATLDTDPDNAIAWMNLSLCDASPAARRAHRAAIQALLERPGVSDQDRAHLSFALGRLLDDSGEYDRAFDAYRTANRIKDRDGKYKPRENAARIASIQRVFTREFLAARKNTGSNTELPVFIVGSSRTGKSLIERLIATHPEVLAGGEIAMLTADIIGGLQQRMRASRPYPECVKQLDGVLTQKLAAELELRMRRDAHSGIRRVTDTLPVNGLHLGMISLLFPRARIIYCTRDMRDTALSIYFKCYGKGSHYAYDLDNIADYLRRYREMMTYWRSVVPMPMLEIPYEQLVRDPEAWTREVLSFIGLNPNADLAMPPEFEIRHDEIGHWRHYSRHLDALSESGDPA